MVKVIVYTKWCLECVWPEEVKILRIWASDKNIKVKRTSYRPDWHRKATKLYGSEDYDAFVVYKGKVEDFVSFVNDCKNKLVKEGKLKDDMPNLQRTEDANREDGAKDKSAQTTNKNEEREG